jgi:hypothetical protein
MDGERFSHSCHDDGSTTGGGAVAEHRSPSRVLARSSGRAKSTTPHSVTQHGAGGGGTSSTASKQLPRPSLTSCSGTYEPTLRAKRILMVDYASTQAQTKGVAPSASREGSQAEAVVAKPLNASSPPTADGVRPLALV